MTFSSRCSSRFFRSLFCVCAGLTFLATFAPGCTTRKQYAINEAILIGERRQLEDEIYRTQFELRDALVENEQLRAELAGSGKGSAAKKNASNAPAASAVRYPGGSALQVAPSSGSNALGAYGTSDGGEIERLPDFVPVPVSRSKQNGTSAAPSPGSTTRPSTTPGSNGGSNRRLSSPKASADASGIESAPYTFGQSVPTRSGSSAQVASSSRPVAPSGSGRIEQTSYQEAKVPDDPEIEPWSPLAPY